MANPLTADQIVKALRAEGVTVVEVGDWRTHNRNHKGAWGPVNGVMIHHTVTSGSSRTVAICRDGYADLPGPLCHGVITKDGRVHLVGYGRANHAGSGDGDVLAAVIAEKPLPADNEANTDGNRHFYGFECENLGDGEDPWPEVQLEAIERASAAICRAHGWSERSVIGHLEWQPGKVDPRGFTMASMRARIADRLTGTPGGGQTSEENDDMALTDEDVKKVAAAVWAHMADNVLSDDPPKVPMERRSWGNTARLARVEAMLKAQATTNAKLVDAVAVLAAGLGDLDPAAIVNELKAAIESIDIRLDVTDA